MRHHVIIFIGIAVLSNEASAEFSSLKIYSIESQQHHKIKLYNFIHADNKHNVCSSMYAYLPMEDSLGSDDLLKDMFPDVRVDSTERVVQQVDVCLLVDSSGQTHPLLLTSTQVDTL